VPAFVAEKILRQAGRHSLSSLEEGLRQLLAVDVALKSSSRDPQALLEEAVLSLCRPAG